MDLYRTRICLSLRSHIFRKSFGMYGGDDGAQTRDLCRATAAVCTRIDTIMKCLEHVTDDCGTQPKDFSP
jgi:hypothetical protein